MVESSAFSEPFVIGARTTFLLPHPFAREDTELSLFRERFLGQSADGSFGVNMLNHSYTICMYIYIYVYVYVYVCVVM
jgi:hypothetical protein